MDISTNKIIDFRQLINLIKLSPVEDGMSHLAEPLLEKFLDEYGINIFLEILNQSKNDVDSFIRLLGRIKGLSTDKSVLAFIAKSIYSRDLTIRDAVLQAIELWNDTSYLPILKSYIESEEWLDKYRGEIIAQLEEKKQLEFIKNNLRVEFSMESEETDEPSYYGDNCSVRAYVKVFFKDQLIYEDSDSEVVYR
jgi:hypothetical protein